MKLLVIGCSHRTAPVAVRERFAFSPAEAAAAMERLQAVWPDVECALLSTCNRTEVYLASGNGGVPEVAEIADRLAALHELDPAEVAGHFYSLVDREAVEHLFRVAAGLDSMVLGEVQVLGQVKQAYQLASDEHRLGPVLHAAFQAAIKAARRVAGETTIHQRRLSIPSIAVADFARQIFERFDDKRTLVLGAGEMAEETLRYLRDEGTHDVVVVNRSYERARELAEAWRGRAAPWDERQQAVAEADLVVSTTGASEPVITLEQYAAIEQHRDGRPLFVLDLAVPRDFDPAIGRRPGVYLYSLDDLEAACAENRRSRDREIPAAVRIVEQEAGRLLADLRHRASGEVIRRLQAGWQRPKEEELRRLFNKLPELDERARTEIHQSFDRLLKKLLHPPLESLRDESRQGFSQTLLDAMARLFQIKD